MSLGKKPFRSINMPSLLIEKIENIIKQPNSLYRIKASFIEDAIRRHIEYIEKKNMTDADLQQVVIDFVEYIKKHSKKD